mmetsp:Transcript_13547/g.33187  ORF Transcript_13547/g.33187 Transcript_13547/m.33187 type:complete len:486 (-) Transcript_13547:177-1634(-)
MINTEAALVISLCVGALTAMTYCRSLCQRKSKERTKEERSPQAPESDADKGDEDSPQNAEKPAMSKFAERSKPSPTLSKERIEDLEFYKAMFGKRVSSSTLVQLLTAKGFHKEASFIGSLNRMRCDFASQTRQMLRRYFSDESKLRMDKSYDGKLRSKSKDVGLNNSISLTLQSFFPPTIFDQVERETLFCIGDRLFPAYRENIRDMGEMVNTVLKEVPLERLRKLLYEKLWEVDPELVAAFHSHPPDAKRWLRSGNLGILLKTKIKKKSSASQLRNHNFRIELMWKKSSDMSKFGGKYVLVTNSEPIELMDAHVVKHAKNPDAFVVKGKSAVHPKHILELTLVADSETSRDHWVDCLQRFRKSHENASMNVALLLNFFLQFTKALQDLDFFNLERISEEIAVHLLEESGKLRPTLPICMRATFFNARGNFKECWNDDAFKSCCSWMKLMVATTMDDLKQHYKYKEDESIVSPESFKRKSSCAIS